MQRTGRQVHKGGSGGITKTLRPATPDARWPGDEKAGQNKFHWACLLCPFWHLYTLCKCCNFLPLPDVNAVVNVALEEMRVHSPLHPMRPPIGDTTSKAYRL